MGEEKEKSLRETILYHFDQHQRTSRISPLRERLDVPFETRQRSGSLRCGYYEGAGVPTKSFTDAEARAALVRSDVAYHCRSLSSKSTNTNTDTNTDTNHRNDVVEAVLHCVDVAFLLSAQEKKGEDSARNSLELALVLALTMISVEVRPPKTTTTATTTTTVDFDDFDIHKPVLDRVSKYLMSPVDSVRSLACFFFGQCLCCLLPSSRQRGAKINAKAGPKLNRPVKQMNDIDNEIKRMKDTIYGLLQFRLVDKTQTVRLAATQACACFADANVHWHCPNKEDEEKDENEALVQLLESLRHVACHDSSPAVRAAALRTLPSSISSLSTTTTTTTTTTTMGMIAPLATIVERLRDAHPKVRVEAVEVLMSCQSNSLGPVVKREGAVKHPYSFEAMDVDTRIEILKRGLNNRRCSKTEEVTRKLVVCRWLKSVGFDPVKLLRKLEPWKRDHETVVENTARAILSLVYLDDKTTNNSLSFLHKELSPPEIRSLMERAEASFMSLEDDGLDAAAAIYLRVKCAVVRQSTKLDETQKSTELQSVVPDVPTLCQMLRTHLARVPVEGEELSDVAEDHVTVCLQLLKTFGVMDLEVTEEGSRRHFQSVMSDVLSSLQTPDDLVQPCIHAVAATHSTETDFIEYITTVLLRLLQEEIEKSPSNDDDLGSNSKNNNDKDNENVPKENKDDLGWQQPQPESPPLTLESKLLRASIRAKLRIVDVVSVVLEKVSGRKNTDDENLHGFQHLIVPMVTSENTLVREGGVSCLGKFALLSVDVSVVETFWSLLFKILNRPREVDAVRAQAALALSDLTLLFAPDEGRTAVSLTTTIDAKGLIRTLTENQELNSVAMTVLSAEICVKLMMSNKFHDDQALARLLVLFFDPDFVYNNDDHNDDHDDEGNVHEIGNAVRLNQILSLFFPAYCMTNSTAVETLSKCLEPLLQAYAEHVPKTKKKGTKGTATATATANLFKKILDYVLSLIVATTTTNRRSSKTPNTIHVLPPPRRSRRSSAESSRNSNDDHEENENDNEIDENVGEANRHVDGEKDNNEKVENDHDDEVNDDDNDNYDPLCLAMVALTDGFLAHHHRFNKRFSRNLTKILGTHVAELERRGVLIITRDDDDNDDDDTTRTTLLERLKNNVENLESCMEDDDVLDELEEISRALENIEVRKRKRKSGRLRPSNATDTNENDNQHQPETTGADAETDALVADFDGVTLNDNDNVNDNVNNTNETNKLGQIETMLDSEKKPAVSCKQENEVLEQNILVLQKLGLEDKNGNDNKGEMDDDQTGVASSIRESSIENISMSSSVERNFQTLSDLKFSDRLSNTNSNASSEMLMMETTESLSPSLLNRKVDENEENENIKIRKEIKDEDEEDSGETKVKTRSSEGSVNTRRSRRHLQELNV